ncbi:MAG: hypothetical protein Q8M15_09615 [Bacteroidota bacterium]|nr:hypothetical protein [Bacteroidota bacterium]
MEIISNFLNSVNERMKSHLYGALIWSFLICNWQVVVALFIDASQFTNGSGKITYIANLFDPKSHWLSLFILPPVLSFIYLFGLPWLDLWIYKYREGFLIKKENAKQDLYKKLGVTVSEYTRMIEKLEKTDQKLKKVLEELDGEKTKYSKGLSEFDTLQTDLYDAKQELTVKTESILIYERRKDIQNFFSGRWNCKYKLHNQGNYTDELFELLGYQYKTIEDNGENVPAFDIIGVDIDLVKNQIVFYKLSLKTEEKSDKRLIQVVITEDIKGRRYIGFERVTWFKFNKEKQILYMEEEANTVEVIYEKVR